MIFFTKNIDLLSKIKDFTSVPLVGVKDINSYTEYESLMQKLSLSGYSKSTLPKIISNYAGDYLPLNNSLNKCGVSVTTRNNEISVSNLFGCSNDRKLTLVCNSFDCCAQVNHPQCDNFTFKASLQGNCDFIEVKALCNGIPYPETHTFYKSHLHNMVESLKSYGAL